MIIAETFEMLGEFVAVFIGSDVLRRVPLACRQCKPRFVFLWEFVLER